MAAQSIATAKIIDNSIGSTGVRMVESIPILDTSVSMNIFIQYPFIIIKPKFQ
jgi:hypothetical protein